MRVTLRSFVQPVERTIHSPVEFFNYRAAQRIGPTGAVALYVIRDRFFILSLPFESSAQMPLRHAQSRRSRRQNIDCAIEMVHRFVNFV